VIKILVKELAKEFHFFVEFERRTSYFYMLIFIIVIIYLIYLNRSIIFKYINKRSVLICLIIAVISAYVIYNNSVFSDFNDSRSEDYKLSAYYYSTNRLYQVCDYGNHTTCSIESQMEKAPGYPFLLSIFFSIFGASFEVATAFNYVVSILTPVLLFMLLYIATGAYAIPFFISILFVFNSNYLFYATQSEVMPTAMLFTVIAYIFITIKAKYRNKKNKYQNNKQACSLELLSLYALLFLSYIRAEFILLLIAYSIINWKDITITIQMSNPIYTFILTTLIVFLMFHSFTEMSFHTS
jgi:hypothetical protein